MTASDLPTPSPPADEIRPNLESAEAVDLRDEGRVGVAFGVAAYLWWGFVPVYFKAVAHIPALEVLAHRIVWSVLLLVILLWLKRGLRTAPVRR